MYSTQGIVLAISDFRERDLRIVLYTSKLGKIEAVAKGAKRVDAKLRGNLDIFNLLDVGFVEGENFNILTSAEFICGFPDIIKNVHTYKAASSIVRAIDYIFGENIQDLKFFQDLRYTLNKINEYGIEQDELSSLYSWLLAKKFQIKILESQGYEYGFTNKEFNAIWTGNVGNKLQFSENSSLLLNMLSGKGVESVRMSRSDFLNIENIFSRIFAYIFNYNFYSWVPVTN